MLKLKQVIIRKIESKFKDSKYVADIVKINDNEFGCNHNLSTYHRFFHIVYL